MLLELFPFVTLNNAMAFIYALFSFSLIFYELCIITFLQVNLNVSATQFMLSLIVVSNYIFKWKAGN